MSYLVVRSPRGLTVSPAVDTEAAVTALGELAQRHTYDTGPDGTERLYVVDTLSLAALRAVADRSRR